MKTRCALILLLISSMNFAQTPLPYASLNESPKNSVYDTAGMYWYEYDANQLEKAGTFQIWNTALNKLLNTRRYEMKRNGDGNIILSYNFSWNLGNESWDTSSRTIYSYHKKGLEATIEVNNYQLGWNNLELDSNFYDANDKVIHKKIYWTTGPTAYALAGQQFYYYDANGALEKFLYLWINSNGTTWDTISRYTYSYNVTPRVDTMVWEDYYLATGWRYNSKSFSTYNGLDQLESIVYMDWSTSSNNWINAIRYFYTYNSDKSKNQEIGEQWDNVEKAYLPYSRSTYLYGSPLGINGAKASQAFILYPNPAENELTIGSSRKANQTKLKMVSQDGRLMHSQIFTGNTVHLDIKSWPSGIYFAIIGEGDNTFVRKVVKK